ncbi:hypothetical protein [Parahaliea aestuarii]|uniref:Uncharacterized protein n=1 Tax=Parahaliea aestuarii TaxID=1852021 RepID=A0A5C9A2U7_9GAMM|nr:hypothetical protein [Parahaliea aestuarii]TXS94399.1 hypothetical protein FVW59_00295 [Parahaliea aestuarii]
MKPFRYTSSDWFGKASAGLLLGFLLSLALGGLLARYGLGGVAPFSIQHQLTMWLVSPLLVIILSACFLFRSSAQAWLWLGGANVFAWVLLAL